MSCISGVVYFSTLPTLNYFPQHPGLYWIATVEGGHKEVSSQIERQVRDFAYRQRTYEQLEQQGQLTTDLNEALDQLLEQYNLQEA